MPRRWPSPRRPRRPTTRSSCTARPGSARPTCWSRSPTTCAPARPALGVRYTTAESLHQRVRRRAAGEGRRGLQAPLPRPRRAAGRRRPVPRGQTAHRRGVLPHLQRSVRGRQPDRALLGPHAEPALDPRRPAPRPLRVGADGLGRAAQPRHQADRAAPPRARGRPPGRRRGRRCPAGARRAHQRQRAPAARRPDQGDRPRLGDRPAARLEADRRAHPPVLRRRARRRPSRRSSSTSRPPSASPGPSWSAPAAPPRRCARGRWRSSSPASRPASRSPRSAGSTEAGTTRPCSTRCAASKSASARTRSLPTESTGSGQRSTTSPANGPDGRRRCKNPWPSHSRVHNLDPPSQCRSPPDLRRFHKR